MIHTVQVKLNATERRMLDEIIANDNTLGLEYDCELFRLLLWREYHRRKGLPKPAAWQWQSAARNGRPATKTKTP